MLSDERRREIAMFLRTRRSRRQPEDLGLPRGRRRRTPGLRREEVAAAAGVSTEWYTWLEQARDVRPSADVLRRVAAALRLEPGEAQHLLTLAGYGMNDVAPAPARPASVSLRLQRLMDQLDHCPAWVLSQRWDILAWNRAATVIYGDLAAMPGAERNGLVQMFLGRRIPGMLRDWERYARDCVAKLRAQYAPNVDDPSFNDLLRRLRDGSPAFEAWWHDHDIQLWNEGVKEYDVPSIGRLVFDFTVLDVADEQRAPLRLVTYVPAPGTGTREKMVAYMARMDAASAPPPALAAASAG